MKENQHQQHRFDDLSDTAIFNGHIGLLSYIANVVCLAPQGRRFIIDDNNRDVVRFMLYYFNNCPLAETVFPDKGYKLRNNLLLSGKTGTGKTLLMEIFSEYLRHTGNPNYFHNVSVMQMMNYFSVYKNIDLYTYDETKEEDRVFKGEPVNLCLNDVGLETFPYGGKETQTVVAAFLSARKEIWSRMTMGGRKFAHLTTNLTETQLEEMFGAESGRPVGDFKTYNIITLGGESRR